MFTSDVVSLNRTYCRLRAPIASVSEKWWCWSWCGRHFLLWLFWFGPWLHHSRLAIIRIGAVLAMAIIESNGVFTWSRPHIQVAVCTVVAIRLTIAGTTQIPRGIIRCHPCCLCRDPGMHGMLRASTTSVLRLRDVNNPIWAAQWCCGGDESFPIFSGPRREDLSPNRATIPLCGLAHFEATCAFEQSACRIFAIQCHRLADATVWTATLGCQRLI